MTHEETILGQNIAILVGFVEGCISPAELDEALSSRALQEKLACFTDTKYPHATNHWYRLSKQNRTSLGGLVNSQAIIEQWLASSGISFIPHRRYNDLLELTLSALPEYVDPPEGYLERIVQDCAAMTKPQKKSNIKARIKKDFRFLNKPPKWIQGADWPIVDDKPLLFVGQLPLDVPDLFHDAGVIYVFIDSVSGETRTVTQLH